LQPGPSPAGGQRFPAPHLKSVPPNFTFGPLVAAYIQYIICLNIPPLLVFGPSFWFSAPPAAVSWRRAWLQPLGWHCAECAVHHERNVREKQHHTYVARIQAIIVISSGELCCCLLPQCEALRICRSDVPIATPSGTEKSGTPRIFLTLPVDRAR